MAVISDYEEEEPMQQQSQISQQPTPPEPVKEPPQVVQPPPPVEVQQPPTPSLTPSPTLSPAPEAVYQHDPVLVSLLEDHKRQPLELLTTVIDFLFRETDLSRESSVEHRVSEIVTAAKRRRTAYDGEDAAPEKVAKVEAPEKVAKVEESKPKVVKSKNETAGSSDVKTKEAEQPVIDDSEGTGLTPNIGNGFDHETYSWTQTLGDATIHIKLPVGSKAKGVACEIKGKTLKAGLKGQEPILQGEFYTPVKPDDCFWSLEDDGTLSIYVTKCNNMSWWRSVVKGEPEINTRKVMPENSRLDELDLETRSTAEKLMYDQRQKAMGLPTSDESTKSDTIKKFMAQHPEMDFSKAKIC